MSVADLAKYGALLYFFGIGAWFATAQAHFDRSSQAKPLLIIVVVLSTILSLVTIVIALRSSLPIERLVTAMVVASAAALLFRWALKTIATKNLGLVFSGLVPPEVVQNGPYRWIRHPLYTAYSLFWISCAFLTASLLSCVLAGFVVILYIVAARAEERDIIQSKLGPAYEEYRKRTGLLLPRLFR
ncbi:methyltransferase family protein [Sphingomonas xinjiangensis]|uniref:Protein-S-isoprenylcysteine O-methyltransferase Ste14 n=1 Tax=Sphingomonas xinjiangensis TaxID=643568 RepID=A0A840YJ40_9SPHN|nr:isoprenylcysteine carboxylmethyltransferase family protein [Sphingomonas xinjiangensis]MBB5712149.1 protein-S-isoprenylcysteine O-methyltransferase Ste14 [Sphingomonas xinjiangensis]